MNRACLIIEKDGEMSKGFYNTDTDTGGFDADTLKAVEAGDLFIVRHEVIRGQDEFRKLTVSPDENAEDERLVINWELI